MFGNDNIPCKDSSIHSNGFLSLINGWHQAGGGEECVFLRGESVETAGLHLHQSVLPVGSGDTEVMDGASQYAKGLPLQGELGGGGHQSLCTHPPRFSRTPGNLVKQQRSLTYKIVTTIINQDSGNYRGVRYHCHSV